MDRDGRRRIVPGAWFFLSILAMVALHLWLPGRMLIPKPCGYGGVALVLIGLGVGIWALCLFKKASTTLRPSKAPRALVARGPFRFSRHPMYLGLTVALCGVAILLGSATPWLIVAGFFVLIARRFGRAEEKAMEDTFGEAYHHYRSRVRRWL